MVNIEIKALSESHERIRTLLREQGAYYYGIEYQKDTYFVCNNGRLKLRENGLETSLIFYERNNTESPKKSNYLIYKTSPDKALVELLLKAYDVLIIVNKRREIFLLDNIRFHLDTVTNLGTFIEIEVTDKNGQTDAELHQQCNKYLKALQISESDLIARSYSDMLLDQK